MHNFTNIQYHNIHSKTIVFILPWSKGTCYSKSQTDLHAFFMNNGISCISMNYRIRDGNTNEAFAMATHYDLKKQELLDQVKEFWASIDTREYDNIILIGTSLGWVVFNQLINYFGDKVKQLHILGYLTGYIDTTKLVTPTVIIQGEFDKYGWINVVKESINWNDIHISYHEIQNADHSFYDVNNPKLRYIDIVNQIIKDEYNKFRL